MGVYQRTRGGGTTGGGGGGGGDMVSTNNLSDVASVATSKSNLGLGNVTNTSDANKPVSTLQAAADALRVLRTPHMDYEHMLIRDEFDRANSVGSLGVTTTHGRSWGGEGAWSITSQRLHKTGAGYALLTLEPHHPFGHWSVTLGPGCDSAEWWLVARVVDVNNYFRVGRGATNVYEIQRIVAGSVGAADVMNSRNTPHKVPEAGDVVKFVNFADDGIDVYVNDVLYWTGAELDDHTESSVGLASASATPTFERVEFLPIAGGDATLLGLAAKASLAGAAFTGAVTVPDVAYGAGWDGSDAVPTRNAVYDKIQAIGNLDGLSDVAITAAAAAHILRHNGTEFVNSLHVIVRTVAQMASLPAGTAPGQFYFVTDDASGAFWYDDGTTFRKTLGLGAIAAGVPVTVRKTAENTRISTTDLTIVGNNDPHLSIPIAANASMEFTGTFFVYGAEAGDFQWLPVVPVGAAGVYHSNNMDLAAAGAALVGSVRQGAQLIGSGNGLKSGVTTLANAAGGIGIPFRMLIRNGSTAGDVVIRWAQNTSSATATAMMVDSVMTGRVL